ncbi:glycerol kinase [Acidocella aquatica]|uniref:Glycerol kinase n=1 Tax=Acidocella aquatica TaxID=1922313 RepID=A0ABQ6A7Z6_9PROT|nr:FGGY family carbohydrate kinase [Acidocella aquatica]GLR67763.1 glycerol kinase [Acidocella aquatica]
MRRHGPVVIGVDQGTTNTKAVAVDANGRILAQAVRPIATASPYPGWVEQDPLVMSANVIACIRDVLVQSDCPAHEVAGLGIANQTETLVIWDPATGKPALPAMVWQCRRGEAEIAHLMRPEFGGFIRAQTGLDLDPTFTAAKLLWVVRHHPHLAAGLRSGALLFGTVDCWLIWHLSGGRVYASEPGNASRTMLFSLARNGWDPQLFEMFGLDIARLPETGPSARRFGATRAGLFDAEIPITAAMGDQQASLFGHGCFSQGDLKVTYGTGAFVWANAGPLPPAGQADGLVRTIAWDLGAPVYAVEGFVMSAGGVLNWLARHFGIAGGGAGVVEVARAAPGAGGVVLVPAFQGLASPWWRADVRAVLSGMTEATTTAEICHAGLEAICLNIRAVLEGMAAAGIRPGLVRADGGPTRSDYLMQLQADILQTPLALATTGALTPFGVALMAGLGAGVWPGLDALRPLTGHATQLSPDPGAAARWNKAHRNWLAAVAASLTAADAARLEDTP